MPGSNLTANENYCRRLGKFLPWCYTNNPDEIWDFCDVKVCGSKFHTPSYKQNRIPKEIVFHDTL